MPSCPASNTAHAEETEGKDRGNNCGGGKGGPEEGKADGEFAGGVEVTKPEDDVRDESTLSFYVRLQRLLWGIEELTSRSPRRQRVV